eukprot:3470528-Rhodomonas_salina.2
MTNLYKKGAHVTAYLGTRVPGKTSGSTGTTTGHGYRSHGAPLAATTGTIKHVQIPTNPM